jgi:hypothetical protein
MLPLDTRISHAGRASNGTNDQTETAASSDKTKEAKLVTLTYQQSQDAGAVLTARLARRSDSRTRAERARVRHGAVGELQGESVEELQGNGGVQEGSWPVNEPAGEVASERHSMLMLTARGADSSCRA